jgi:hypothetical protein
MKILKHFYKVAVGIIKSITCSHKELHSASCPFTGYTYTTCSNCGTRTGVSKTAAGKHGNQDEA